MSLKKKILLRRENKETQVSSFRESSTQRSGEEVYMPTQAPARCRHFPGPPKKGKQLIFKIISGNHQL